MSKIDYQKLREIAEKTKIAGEAPVMPFDQRINALNDFMKHFSPDIALALLDERERNQQYIKHRDQENEDIALTVGKLCFELEAAKSKLNEQREYYEGVISDGSKRIAELEKSEEQLINERDHAESALADMYFAATGDRPEWSNWFGFSDAVDAVVDRIADLEAKQPPPVVPDNASGSLAYAYKELTPEIMRGHIAVFERYGIAPNDSITTIQALRIALDGIERSDAMLHGAEPVSQTYKLPPLSSNEVNDAAWKLHNMLTEHVPLNGRQFNNLKGCFYEALKVAMRNYPVTPDGWISCSEKMPEIGELNWRTGFPLLVTCEIGVIPAYYGFVSINGDNHYGFMESFKYGDGRGNHPQTNEYGLISNATHWMPLPEPPQEVNRG
ncbi:DUF551 domain-containing protein [Escherichia coli]|nr:ead/Ea22-like family protein [Escherichia coli]MBC6516645.1 DUF551 domain-containing protein [Escherichia coli]